MKILKWIGITLLALVLILVSLLTAVWLRPELVLNEKRVRQAMRYAPADLKLDWKGFRLDFSRLGWRGKRVDFELKDLCFSYGERFRGCVPEFHVDVSFEFKSIIPSITRVDSAVIQASEIEMRPDPNAVKEPSPAGPLPDLRAPSFEAYYPAALNRETLGRVALVVEKFRMISKDGPPLEAALKLEKETGAGSQDIPFSLSARATQGKNIDIRLDGKAEIPAGQPLFAFRGGIKGKAAGFNADVPLSLRWGKTLELQADPNLTQGKNRYATDLRLRWTQELLRLDTGAMPIGVPVPNRRLELERCSVSAKLDKSKGHPDDSDISCTLALHARTKTKILPTVRTTLLGNLKLEPTSQSNVRADFTLKERGERPILPSQVDARAQGEFNLVSNELIGTPKLELAATVGVDDFQRWVPILRGTPFAIPAPLNVLAGPIKLEAKLDRVDGRKELGINAVFTTDMKGGNQVLNTRGDAAIRITEPYTDKRAVFVDAKFVMKDVLLEAPPLALGLPPNAIPDARFVTRAEMLAKEKARQAAKYDPGMPLKWKLAISNEQPVRLNTNLLGNPIPVGINISLSDDSPMVGDVTVLPMPVKLFSKTADVRSIKVSFLPKSDVAALDGVVVSKNPEVEIRILLLGNTNKPRVEFESDPPLNRDQIVQVLLFNKSLREVQGAGVTDDEASSASSVSQAMSEGAFGLFSLFFLSSTPIQSVGYDPATQSYNIRFKLGGKTTLAVGSDFGGRRELSLRRNLGGPWALRTELQQAEQRPNVLLTVIEWFKRF
ncbi:MAG: hypothetical protein EOP11_04955 [Proteobacteria bacterium]|nr:MAG: hypothetical protein EOP11_04955 [Pseudomonadota bacterium]